EKDPEKDPREARGSKSPCSGAWTRTTIRGFKVLRPALGRRRIERRTAADSRARSIAPAAARCQGGWGADALELLAKPPVAGGRFSVARRRCSRSPGSYLAAFGAAFRFAGAFALAGAFAFAGGRAAFEPGFFAAAGFAPSAAPRNAR